MSEERKLYQLAPMTGDQVLGVSGVFSTYYALMRGSGEGTLMGILLGRQVNKMLGDLVPELQKLTAEAILESGVENAEEFATVLRERADNACEPKLGA